MTRAPSDVLRLGVATVLLIITVAVAWLFDKTIVENVARTARGLDSLAADAVAAVASLAEIAGLVVFGGGIVLAVVRREWHLLMSVVVAAAVAVLLVLLLGESYDAEAQVTHVDTSLTLVDPGHVSTAAGLAALTAFATAAGPWVSRRWRRWAWAVVITLTLIRLLAAPISFETAIALLSGWTAGAGAVVAFGAPSRRPTEAAIAAGMRAVGVPVTQIAPLAVDARGSTPYLATAADGRKLFVKALGEDERSADLMFRLYRSIQPENLGDERPASSLRRMVEHEALVALAARDLGVRTPRLVCVATAEPNGFVLSYEAIAGRSLDELDATEMTDDVLAATWEQLTVLRHYRVAHRDLRLANVFLSDDGQVWIIDFGFAELAASDLLLATDVAEFLASSSTFVQPQRAVAAGVAAIGADAVSSALARLKLPMLSGATRTAMKASPGTLDELRRTVQLTSSA